MFFLKTYFEIVHELMFHKLLITFQYVNEST